MISYSCKLYLLKESAHGILEPRSFTAAFCKDLRVKIMVLVPFLTILFFSHNLQILVRGRTFLCSVLGGLSSINFFSSHFSLLALSQFILPKISFVINRIILLAFNNSFIANAENLKRRFCCSFFHDRYMF